MCFCNHLTGVANLYFLMIIKAYRIEEKQAGEVGCTTPRRQCHAGNCYPLLLRIDKKKMMSEADKRHQEIRAEIRATKNDCIL
ncbi:hypothetical protein L1887_05718 [Cichorium endivia]|nr:hypothetical protein L1887_05718 [Cichorium endivia]